MKARLGFLLFFLISSAHAEINLSAIQTRVTHLSEKLAAQNKEIEEVSEKLDKLSAQIQRLKSGQKRNPSLIHGYRLENLLTEAKPVSDRLDQMMRLKKETESELRTAQMYLTAALDEAIQKQRRLANQKNMAISARRAAALQLEKLSLMRMQLTLSDPLKPLPPSTSGLKSSTNDPSELKERLNALSDFRKRLTEEVASIESELIQAKRERFVRRELAHLFEEESFFGEQGFVTGTVRVQKNEPTTLARSAMTGAASEGGAAPSPPIAPTAGAPALAPIMDSQPNVEGASAPSVSEPFGERDPLAQLASELGISPREVQDLSTHAVKETSEDRIHWLEKRLVTTHQIINRLDALSSDFEGRLHN